MSFAASTPAETALCACWTTFCATCFACARTPLPPPPPPRREPPERPLDRLLLPRLPLRLLLRPLLDRPALRLLLRPAPREALERPEDFRRPLLLRDELRDADLRDADLRDADLRDADLRDEPRDADLRDPDLRDADLREDDREDERADDPPRLRADFRPRFEPPDRRDELLLPDFLRDPRLEVAIPGSP